MTGSGVPLFIDAIYERQTLGFHDLCSRAMDQALGIEKVSLSSVIQLNSSALDLYRNTWWWLTPAFSDFLEAAAKSYALYVDLQATWLHLMWPYATLAPEKMLNFAAPDYMAGNDPGRELSRAADEAELSMETAAGRDLAS